MNVYSAGVLLYMKRNNITYFLLGKDCKYDSWSDFGGKTDDKDRRDPLKTASREFYEETCGVIFPLSDIFSLLLKEGHVIECKSYKKNQYFMVLLKLPEKYINESSTIINHFKFQNILINLKPSEVMRSFREKSELRWFTLDEITNAKMKIRGVFFYSLMQNLNRIKQICA
tara:strand:+ start:594 stop:1106 length:513 start_codon:yes stop_codon:yes gene_type:complete